MNHIFLAIAFAGICQVPQVERLGSPEQGFFSKRLDVLGIPIEAHADVADRALIVASERLTKMLENQPEAVANLRERGVRLHIIGKDQVTSDLPEHRHMKGKPFEGKLTIDERTRGVGGVLASCGEENLLKLEKDRYRGRDICVHEFAHSLFEIGLSEDVRERIVHQYRESKVKGLWKNAYAATNPSEFFAELSMWYFGTFGDTKQLDPKPEPGNAGLKAYDPGAFALLDDIYTGRLRSQRVELAANKVHLVARPATDPQTFEPENGPRTSVTFRNQTLQEIQVLWLPGDGSRRAYNRLSPGEAHEQSTFAGHRWLVTDAADQPLAVFVAEKRPGLAEIHGSMQP